MKKFYVFLLFSFLFGKNLSFANKNNADQNLYFDSSLLVLKNYTSDFSVSENVFHLFTHGKSGELLIDGKWRNSEEIAAWFLIHVDLNKYDHINLYGCEFAKGEKGLAAVKYLEKQLHKKISASTNITGAGGDWFLEVGGNQSTISYSSYPYSLQCANFGTAPNQDFDCDGIINSLDIDDDNDGVVDSTESPSCFYLASEWNTGAKPAGGVTITSGLTTTASNFSGLTNGVNNTTAVTFTAGQAILNANVYLFTFARAVKLDALYLQFNTTTQFAGNTKIQGSNTNNGSDWVDLSAAITLTAGTNVTANGTSVTTSLKYPITLNNTIGYKYIRITGSGASNIAAQNASEVYFDFNIASYVASYYPKATCTDANIDGDGAFAHMDLDSDGDGCSDAFEAGATTVTTANYVFPYTDTNSDGLVNAVDADGEGVTNYTSTYHAYAESKTVQACKDTDGDGILDITDIDDDNDGIPDFDEQTELPCATSICNNWESLPVSASTTAPRTVIVDGEEVSYTITTNYALTNMGNSAWTTLQCGLGTLTGIAAWHQVTGVNQTTTFNFSKPVTNFQFVLSAIETPEAVQVVTNNTEGQQKICESCNKASISSVNSQTVDVAGAGSNAEIFRVSGPTYTTVSVRTSAVPASYYIAFGVCALKTYSDAGYADLDTDGDGVFNRLDLDSDGDNCPDLKEARVSPTTEVITPSTTNNVGTSYGIASAVGAQLNPLAADTNNDGLNDSVDTDVNGSPDYSITYTAIALSAANNLCSDIDGDGTPDLTDIDDDNDGITDAVESPTCFFTRTSDLKSTTYITSDLSYTTSPSQPFSLAFDGNTATWADIDGGSITNKNLILMNMPLANPIPLSTVTIQIGINNSFGTSSVVLQGWTGSSWENLSAAQPMATASTTYTFTNTLHVLKTYSKYRIRGLAGYATNGTRLHEVNVTFAQPFVGSLQPKQNCTNDLDSDGIYNHQDLDSDGDGCSDLVESGVSPSTDVFTPSSVNNSNGASYGIVAAKLAGSQLNPAAADTNNDGLNDSVDTDLNGITNYVSTYIPYATGANFAACLDSDGDGVLDIDDVDDDNDGILDAVESPSCFYTETEAKNLANTTVASDFSWVTANPLTFAYDGTTTNIAWVGTAVTNIAGLGLIDFTVPTQKKALLSNIQVAVGVTALSSSTSALWRLEGWDGTTWVGLSAAQHMNTVSSTYTFNNTLQPTVKYLRYRIAGTTTAAGVSVNGRLIEVYVNYNNYIPSQNPKATCTSDLDGDGIPNHLDLDSDGDGCSDLLESGVSPSTDVFTPSSGTNNEGKSYGILASKLAGSQLNPAVADVNNDGLNDSVDADLNSVPNYTSTYNPYATGANIAACLDSDGDGINDVIDIDDDNDGILDAVESPACFYTLAEAVAPQTVSSELTPYLTNVAGNTIDKNSATYGAFNGALDWVNKELYKVSLAKAIAINSMQLDLTTWALSSNASMTFKLQGSNDNTVWDNLSAAVASTATSGTFSVNNTLLPNNTYRYYRLLGVAGTSYYGGVTEIRLLTATYNPSANPKPTCVSDTDNDGLLNHLDLDSDGDGCSDAQEGGATSILTANFKFTGPVGANGLDNTLETADNGVVKYASTYNLYAINSSIKACIDTDGDGIVDVADIDDDNDGIPDVVECPTLFASMTGNGGFSAAGASITNWYMGLTSVPLPIAEPFTPTAIPITNNGVVYNYGIGGGSQGNSTLTGGLFDLYGGTNTATGVQYALQEGDPQHPVVSKLPNVLVAGAAYNYSFDLGNRASGSANKYIVMLYNADTKMPEKIIESGVLNTLPAYSDSPSYKNFSGSFVPASSANYYLLFYPSISGGAADDFVIDRVAVVGAGATACDLDNDGIPNYLDLDSDGDGCPDLKESGVSPLTDLFTPSSTNNAGLSYGIASPANSQLNPANADVNNNGLNDSVENGTTGNVNYGLTYSEYALIKTINLCSDLDNDGKPDFIDIDDDNDGIPDATESPSCFYTETEAKTITSVTSELTQYSTNVIGNSYDNNVATESAFATGQDWVGKTVFEITPAARLAISAVNFDIGDWYLSNNVSSTFKLQGWNGTVWIDLSAAMANSNTTDFSINNTLQVGVSFSKYRIVGVAGTCYYSGVNEITLNAYQYVTSLHPKENCAEDVDGDGKLNHQDLDSDGDGCSDAYEGGATTLKTPNYQFTGAMGANGLADVVETTVDSGIIKYSPLPYAYNTNLVLCLDSDNDGVGDLVDIDDDNDGILDVVEMGTCQSLLNGIVDGTFEAAAGVAWNENTNTGNLNSTLGPTGWTSTGSSDTWTGSFSLNGSGFWGGAMNGVPATPDGSVFAAIYNGFTNEAINTTLPSTAGIQAGQSYTFEFYQIFGGVNGLTPTGRQAQLRFTIDGVAYLSNAMTYNGNNPKQWEKTSVTFTATTNAPVISIDILSTGDGNYIGIDGISLYKQNEPGCGNIERDDDGDGVVNRLDLDSDGDGCPDAKEAILFNNPAVTTIAGDVKNGSGGGVTSTVNTANAIIPGPYGSNGFADSIESATNPDAYKYVYTYLFIATDPDVNTCMDTDGDGIPDFAFDIDSDNDGIVNAVESPSCFYTEAQAMNFTGGVKSDFTWITASPLSNIYDQNTTSYGQVSPAINIQNKALITFDLPLLEAAILDNIKLNVVTTSFGAGTWRFEGLDRATNTWTALSVSQALPAGINTFTNTLHPTMAYYSYRIVGTSSTVATDNARLAEFTIQYKNYIASLHRVKSGCNSDTDGDGVPNYIDRDSDGDGCPDAVEGSVSGVLEPGGFYNLGGIQNGDRVIAAGPYGSNGLADGVETSPESSVVNYTSTYSQYAIANNLNLCIDTDKDGVPDVIDIDDDNDGILDITEESCTTSITSKTGIIVTKPATITYNLDTNQTLVNLVDGVDANDYIIYNPVGTLSNAEWFRIEFPSPKILTQWEIGQYSGQTLFTTSSTYKVQGSLDGTTWTDLTGTLTYTNTLTGQSSQSNSNIANFAQNDNAYKYYRYFGISGTAGGGWATEFYFREKNCVELDTDGDGIPNRLDLDSDGDGCSDALEAGATNDATTNFSFTGAVGTNGLVNTKETTVDSGIINYTSTYNQYALANNLASCADSDKDGVNDMIDIDDDNDGIPDAVESPSCFYSYEEISVPATVTTAIATTGSIANINDSNKSTLFNFTASASTNNITVFEVTPQYPIEATALQLEMNTNGQAAFSNTAGSLKVEGWNGTSWVILLPAFNPATAPNNISNYFQNLTFTQNQAVKYTKFRLQGLAVAGTVTANLIREIRIIPAVSYVASAYPKPSCSDDFDGDGLLNHHDLDSDGDGCFDKFEASVPGATLTGVYTDSLTIPQNTVGDAGTNGLSDALEVTVDNGVLNYNHTYYYALNTSIKACTDSDGDGIPDLIDIDDDNDGILDTVEGNSDRDVAVKPTSNTYNFTSCAAPAAVENNTVSFTTTNGDLSIADSSTTTSATNGFAYVEKSPTVAAGAKYTLTFSSPVNLSKLMLNSVLSPIGEFTVVYDDNTTVAKLPITLVPGKAPADYGYSVYAGTALGIYNDGQYGPYVANSNWGGTSGAQGNGIFQFPTLSKVKKVKSLTFTIITINAASSPTIVAFVAPIIKENCNIDTDNDGIANNLDLDSDGDGCADAFEAGTYNQSGVTMQAGDVKNGSGGAVTSTVSNPAAIVAGPYGTNGFANSVETAADSGTYKGSYTYADAINALVHNCCPIITSNTITADQTVCSNVTPAALTGSTPTLTTTGNTLLYQWMSSITSSSTGFTNISGATSKDYTFTAPLSQTTYYKRVAYVTGCSSYDNTSAAVTITVNSNSAGAASSSPTVCVNNAITNITHTTTGATGIDTASATGLPTGVTASWSANTITISGIPTSVGIFNYSIPLTGGCVGVNASGTITVMGENTVGIASSSPTVCISSPIANITHTTTGATGIGTASGLPAGLSAVWALNTITISGTPTSSGTFNYTIPLIGGCGNVSAVGTIVVIPSNTAGVASSSPTVCVNTAILNITHTTTGATSIGSATGLPNGVTAAWASNMITISGAPTESGIFNYSIPLHGGCGIVNAIGVITVTAANTTTSASSNPTICITSAIPNITYTTTGATGIGVAAGLPAGVTAVWASNTITISGTPTESGSFSYNIPLIGGCGTVEAVGTITVTPANTAGGASSSPTLCINSVLTDITHTTTGATGIGTATGLPTGVTAAWGSDTITISGTPTVSGTFNYSIPLTGSCGSVNAAGTIIVTPANTAGTASSNPTLCINTALVNITHSTTGATGIGAAAGLPAGVTAAWASNTITISGTPTASGTFSYSIPLTGGCGTVSATGTITVRALNTASGASSTPTLCINTALVNITHTTTGATGIGAAIGLPAGVTAAWASNTITISGTPSSSGTFNYSIPLTGGCSSVSATGTIIVTPENTTTGASSNPTLCINTALVNIMHTTTGATGIGAAIGLPTGVTADWTSNTITISGTPTQSGTFSYSIPLTGGCGTVEAVGTITVKAANTVSTASSSPTVCISTPMSNITHTTTGVTGIGTVTGLPAGVTAAWASNTITISGTPTASGEFTYSIPLTGGCGAVNATGTITVTPANAAGTASSSPTLCISTVLADITHTTTGATGIGTATGLPTGVTAVWASNTITISGTPTVSGTFDYSIPLTGGCGTVEAVGTIIVTPANTAGTASSNPTVCISTAIADITHTTTGATGIGTATGLPTGVTAVWALNKITISGTPTQSGIFNYSIPLTGGCGAVNATGTITVTPANTTGTASSSPTVCINTAITAVTHTTTGATGIGTASGLPAGVTVDWSLDTITISGTPTESGTFDYSIPLTGGCGSVEAVGTITVTPANTAGTASSNPTVCISTPMSNITHTTTGATGIGTVTGLPAGVTAAWASNTITISGTPTESGTFNYIILLTGGCGSVEAAGTITVTPANAAGTASSSPTACINTAITNITHTTTGATGIGSATGLPAGVTAVWASNTITISGTPTSSGIFNYSIPLTGGCGSVNAAGTITVTPANTAGTASSSPTVCINTAITNITHVTTGATGIGTATGLPAGVTAVWASDIITISGTPTVSGTFTYDIPLLGGCSNASAIGTIKVIVVNTAGIASSSPIVCINTAIADITHATTGATGIGTATGFPTGVTAAWTSNTIIISGTPTENGIFDYIIPLTGGCGSIEAAGTIIVTPANTAGTASSSPTLCISTVLTDITHTTTGATGIGTATGLPAGVNAAWASNTITISGTPTVSGTFDYSIPLTGGCGSVEAIGTIIVTPANTAGMASSNPTVCINTAITDIIHTTTGATGIGTATGLPTGVTATWASNTITISGTATESGTFDYSIPLTGGCDTVEAAGTIIVTPVNTVDAASSNPTLCINRALVNITHATTGATGIGVAAGLPAGVTSAWASNTITISGTPTVSGTFNYSIPLTGGCDIVNATGVITVTPAPSAGVIGGALELCGSLTTVYSSSQSGGTWSSSNAAIASIDPNTGVLTAISEGKAMVKYTVVGTGGCGDAIAEQEITILPMSVCASLELKKTAVFNDTNSNSIAEAGETITYSFTVINTGNVTITGITINDPLVAVTGGPISLAPNASDSTTFTAVYTIKQSDVDSGKITNSATATGKDPDNKTVTVTSDDPSTPAPGDSTITDLPQSGKLDLTKTAVFNDTNNNGIAEAGETITYSFTVTNTGNVTITGIIINDPLVAVTGGPISLAPNVSDSTTFSAVYTIKQSDVDSGKITNSATATGKDPDNKTVTVTSDDPLTPVPGDSTITDLPQSGKLDLTKTAVFNDTNNNGIAEAGETITYSFTVTNTGNVTITGIIINDPLVAVTGGPISLAPNASDSTTFTAVYTIKQSDVDSGKITNSATATGKDPDNKTVTVTSDDPSTPAPGDSTITDLPQSGKLDLTKTAVFNDTNNNGIAEAGETITYSFTVTNTGNVTITGIIINDPLVAVTGGPISLAPNVSDSTTFSAVYTIKQSDVDSGKITNSATATGKDPDNKTVTVTSDDPSTPAPGDSTITDLPQSGKLDLTKTAVFNDTNNNGIAEAGETITYSFTVTNTGNVTITGIIINDPLVAVTGGPISLAPNASDSTTFTAVYTIKQSDVDSGKITNSATATGKDPDNKTVTVTSDDPLTPVPGDSTITDLPQSGKLDLTKTAVFNDTNNNGIAEAGETITYSFTVTNTGNVTITGIIINDPLVAVTGGPISLAPNASDSTTFTAVYTIKQSDVDSGKITNSATATGKDPDNKTVTVTSDDPLTPAIGDSTITDLPQSGSLELMKMAVFNDLNGNEIPEAGETITYTFTVKNIGSVTISNITINDPMVTVTGGPISLAPDAKDNTTFRAVYTVLQSDIDAGQVSNLAIVTGKTPDGTLVTAASDDPMTATPRDRTITPLPQSGKLDFKKTAVFNDENGNKTAEVGETITYSFIVKNTGSVTIKGITINDPLVAVTGGPIDLAPNASDSTTFKAVYKLTQDDVNAEGVTNQALVIGTEAGGIPIAAVSDDPSTPAPEDSTVTLLQPHGAISLKKKGEFNDINGNGSAEAGETITYTFEISNTGAVDLLNVVLDDQLQGIVVTGKTIPVLAVGATDSTTFKGTYTLTQADITRKQVDNQAVVSANTVKGQKVLAKSDDPLTAALEDATVIHLKACELIVYDIVSPDGDGKNEELVIEGLDCYTSNKVEIYNRWGIKVFEMENYGTNGNVFNGYSDGRATYKRGQKLPTGTYYYILLVIDSNNTIHEKTGPIYVITD